MEKILFSIAILIITISCAEQKEYLFNGNNLDGWTVYVGDSSIVAEDYFYVNEGMIETVGIPNGYLRTNKIYSDYHLHVEWRYPENPTNSGIFLHIDGPDKLWPNHYQGQLKYKFAGDFIVSGEGISAMIRDTVYTSTENPVKPILPKIGPNSEKTAGKWNNYDIFCKGGKIELKVNGITQNVVTKCSLTKGNIGLQAEGSKIQFRNLWVENI